jgi:hypothetical protein
MLVWAALQLLPAEAGAAELLAPSRQAVIFDGAADGGDTYLVSFTADGFRADWPQVETTCGLGGKNHPKYVQVTEEARGVFSALARIDEVDAFWAQLLPLADEALVETAGFLAESTAVFCAIVAHLEGLPTCTPSNCLYDYGSGQCGTPSTACEGVPVNGTCEGTALKECGGGAEQVRRARGSGSMLEYQVDCAEHDRDSLAQLHAEVSVLTEVPSESARESLLAEAYTRMANLETRYEAVEKAVDELHGGAASCQRDLLEASCLEGGCPPPPVEPPSDGGPPGEKIAERNDRLWSTRIPSVLWTSAVRTDDPDLQSQLLDLATRMSDLTPEQVLQITAPTTSSVAENLIALQPGDGTSPGRAVVLTLQPTGGEVIRLSLEDLELLYEALSAFQEIVVPATMLQLVPGGSNSAVFYPYLPERVFEVHDWGMGTIDPGIWAISGSEFGTVTSILDTGTDWVVRFEADQVPFGPSMFSPPFPSQPDGIQLEIRFRVDSMGGQACFHFGLWGQEAGAQVNWSLGGLSSNACWTELTDPTPDLPLDTWTALKIVHEGGRYDVYFRVLDSKVDPATADQLIYSCAFEVPPEVRIQLGSAVFEPGSGSLDFVVDDLVTNFQLPAEGYDFTLSSLVFDGVAYDNMPPMLVLTNGVQLMEALSIPADHVDGTQDGYGFAVTLHGVPNAGEVRSTFYAFGDPSTGGQVERFVGALDQAVEWGQIADYVIEAYGVAFEANGYLEDYTALDGFPAE